MILLLGHSGYVGTAFAQRLTEMSFPFRGVSRAEADYTNPAVLARLIRDTSPEFLLNAAGYTGKPNVDACELHRGECLAANALLPDTIRRVCEDANLPWGHVSSGCLYSGRRDDGLGFTEQDPPNFCFRTNHCSWYSGCKALGEELLAGAANTYVWRLRIPFNRQDGSRNYLSKLLRYERLLDVENSISHLDETVDACLQCWTKRVPFGIYHVTNSGSITTRRITQLISQHLPGKKKRSTFSPANRSSCKRPRKHHGPTACSTTKSCSQPASPCATSKKPSFNRSAIGAASSEFRATRMTRFRTSSSNPATVSSRSSPLAPRF